MTWTTPKDLKAQLLKRWERGDLLREALNTALFPLRLKCKTPSSTDITERFSEVRTWALRLSSVKYLRVEWKDVAHRVQGKQRIPAEVWVNSIDIAIDWLGKRREWQRFCVLLGLINTQCPALLDWLDKRPLQALEFDNADWKRLLSVVLWMQQHPRPNIYLRQIDIPDVHSKFIEDHRRVLSELLDLVLPEEAIDLTQTGVTGFAARYGFLQKPTKIRFRFLDPDVHLFAGIQCADVSLDAESFSHLMLNVQQVFITENEINFLAFPKVKNAIVIFGAGYGWDALAQANWLAEQQLFYWGDIDTHGFAILDQLRRHFPHVESILMDRATLDAHAIFWGKEEQPNRYDLLRLTTEELRLYNDLRDNQIRERLRLEQEHVRFGWVHQRIEELKL